jgi:hypothetical protein
MRNRKRHSARPVLEAVEPRVAPSSMGIQAHHRADVVAHVVPISNPARLAEQSQRANDKAIKRLEDQLAQIYVRSLQHTPSAIPTKAEQEASQVSNVFKSIGQSL